MMGFASVHFNLATLAELGCSVFSTLAVIAVTTLIIVNCRKKKEKEPLDLNKIMVDGERRDAQSMHGVDTEEHFPGLHDAMAKDNTTKDCGETSKTAAAA